MSVTLMKAPGGAPRGWLATIARRGNRYWRYFGKRECGSLEAAELAAREWDRETRARLDAGEVMPTKARRLRANGRTARVPSPGAPLTIRPHDERTCEYARGWGDVTTAFRSRIRRVAEHFDRQEHLVLPTKKVAEMLRDLEAFLTGGSAGNSRVQRIDGVLRSSSGSDG
jgi:hypothetical protein